MDDNQSTLETTLWIILAVVLMSLLFTDEAYAGVFVEGEVGSVVNDNVLWDDGESFSSIVRVGYRYKWNNVYLTTSYTHTSQPLVGIPFNDRSESYSDFVGVGIGYEW